MNKKLIILLFFATLLILPTITLAVPPEGVPTFSTTDSIVFALGTVENFVFAIFLGLAVIMFIIAGYYFLTSDVTKGRSAVIYGVIGVGVAILSYSIFNIVANLLGS